MSVLAAVRPARPGCGGRPAAAPPAQATIASRIVVRSCTGVLPRQMPLRAAVLLEGHGGRVHVDTGARGRASVRLTPGRYAVVLLPPALHRGLVSLRLDGRPVPATGGRRVVDIAGGRHLILLLVGLWTVECNGNGAAG
ncbi:MAG: hypothetical protein ACTHNU_00075 [Gaiellales bacterium]